MKDAYGREDKSSFENGAFPQSIHRTGKGSAEALLDVSVGSYIPHNDNIPLEHVVVVHKPGREAVHRMFLELYKHVSKVAPYLALVAHLGIINLRETIPQSAKKLTHELLAEYQ